MKHRQNDNSLYFSNRCDFIHYFSSEISGKKLSQACNVVLRFVMCRVGLSCGVNSRTALPGMMFAN